MTSNVLCKYYMNGACAFGDNCRFSHDRSDETSQVCKYYLAGNCAYGDRCRYEHSKPSWSSRGQPAPPSRYTAPTEVHKPAAGPANNHNSNHNLTTETSMSSQPNWDDFMTPDEMDEFEQWQLEQAEAAAVAGPAGPADADFEDIMDPADIPLCNEYAATGYCSAGEDCLYIHGDACEICGYYCVHPYSPELTAQHQAACSEALAAAGYQFPQSHDLHQQHHHHGPPHDSRHTQQQHWHLQPPPPPPAAAGATDSVAAESAAHKANGVVSPASPVSTDAAVETDQDSAVVARTVSAAIAAVVLRSGKDEEAAAVDDVADQLSSTHISSSTTGASST